jgi:hypothetical protein
LTDVVLPVRLDSNQVALVAKQLASCITRRRVAQIGVDIGRGQLTAHDIFATDFTFDAEQLALRTLFVHAGQEVVVRIFVAIAGKQRRANSGRNLGAFDRIHQTNGE